MQRLGLWNRLGDSRDLGPRHSNVSRRGESLRRVDDAAALDDQIVTVAPPSTLRVERIGQFGSEAAGEQRARSPREESSASRVAMHGVSHCTPQAAPPVRSVQRRSIYTSQGTLSDVLDIHATILRFLGLDHEKLTYPYQGRDFRLTDVEGKLDLWKRLSA